MNKTDRLLAILLELQRKKISRAEDLAGLFETSVRTIYRDIQALCEAGVPIIGTPGSGYSLMEGYFLPPVSFTPEEAVALLIGTDFIEQRFDESYRSRAQTARRKIESILPDNTLEEISRLNQVMRLLNTGKPAVLSKEKEYLEGIRQAILKKQKIAFHYNRRMEDAEGNRQSTRKTAPYGLVFVQGSWMLIAWCELRRDIRHFRLSRMTDLAVLDESFDLPASFDLKAYLPPDDRHIRVHLRFHSGIADKVKDSQNYYMETMEETPEGLHVYLRVRQPEELLDWVLSWGANVVVLEPESFRQRILEEVLKIIKSY